MDLICGINPVVEALSAGRRHFDRLLIVKGLRNRRVSEAMARASQLGVPLRFETREALDRLSAGVPHQGVIAVVSPKPAMSLEDVLKTAHEPALLVVLDGVEDPRNLGAIIRTVEAAGADGVLLPERNNAGLSETVNRASAGALEHVKVARIGNVSQTLDQLKDRGIWVIGLDAGGERWDKVDFKRPIALVLGGEGKGLRRLVREHCDQVVALPLFGHVSSLNVSVAAGAVMYEVVRQRGAVPSHVRPIPPAARPHGHNHVTGPGADDSEGDPGWIGPSAADRDRGEDDETAPMNLSVVQIHDEEDAAWRVPAAPGPGAERRGQPRVREHERGSGSGSGSDRDRDRDRKRGRRDRDRGRGRDRGRDEHRGAAPGAPDAPPVEGVSGEQRPERSGEGPRGKRRRRRRGRRPGSAPGGEAPSSSGEPVMAGPPPERFEHGDAPAAPSEGAPVGGGNDERRRARRRRRRRRG
jgi:23S rRNA (guanosine2251-2'-O)-methyltransferase